MAIIRSWSGDGLTPGPLTTSSAGLGDIPFDGYWNTPSPTVPDVVATGPRSPQIAFVTVGGKPPAVYWNIPSQTVGSGRVYFDTPSTWNSSAHSLVQLHSNISGALAARISLAGTGTPGQLRLYNSTGSTLVANTPSGTLSLSMRYRIEWIIDQVAGVMTVKLFQGDNTIVLATLSGTSSFGPSHAQVLFGSYSGATPNYSMDDFAVGSDASFIGPKVIATGQTVSVWNGTAEVSATITVWNGTAEVSASL